MGWISVDDQLPCIGQYCIVTDGEREALYVYHPSGFIRIYGPSLKSTSWKPAYVTGRLVDIGVRGELDFIPDGAILLEGGSEWAG